MMFRNLLISFTLWAATAVAAYGAIYTWTDDQGTVHFSEDESTVPEKYQGKARNIDESAPQPAETAPEPQAAGDGAATSAGTAAGVAAADLPDYTTRDEWQAELQKQETAMTGVVQRLDELATAVNRIPRRTGERDRLEDEHRTLQTEYNAMKARYYRLVEAARKAGFPVNLQQ